MKKTIGPIRPGSVNAEAPSLRRLQATMVGKPTRRGWGARIPNEVTPESMRYAIHAARNGQPARYFAALDFFFRLDDEIRGALSSLIEAVLQEDPIVTPLEESAEATRQVEDVEAWLSELDLVELLREALESRFFGFNAAWMPWGTMELANGRTVQAATTYELLPRDWIYADKLTKDAEHTTLFVGDRPYHEYPPGSLLLFTERKLPSYTDIDFTSFGVGYACSRFAIYGYFNWDDWAAYAEVFGLPTLLGILLEGWDTKDKELLEAAVFGAANDARGIITDKAKIEQIAAAGGGADVFERLGDKAREVIAKIIKSESLTDNMGDRGSYAAMVTVNGIRLDVAKGIAKRLSKMLVRRLITPFCNLNYGRRLVRVDLRVKEIKNMLQELAIDRGLQDMGADLPLVETLARYGRRPPEDGEEVLVRGPTGGLPGVGNLFGGA